MTRDQLLAQVQALPAEALLPAGWVRQQLEVLTVEPMGEPAVYDVTALAHRWRRSASYVRALLETGQLPGAHKSGRRWQVSASSVAEYEAAQAQQPRAGVASLGAGRARPRRGGSLSLDSWREERRARGSNA